MLNSNKKTITSEARLSYINSLKTGGFFVLTDNHLIYQRRDRVFPLHPENQFFLDDIDLDRMRGANVLEIGLGSGVLSIGAIKAGAAKVGGKIAGKAGQVLSKTGFTKAGGKLTQFSQKLKFCLR